MTYLKILKGFTRITSTGKWIPEVDGIRFVAILSVMLFHASFFYSEKHAFVGSDLLNHFFGRGYVGVYLFFVLSGYILSAPFAEHFSSNGKLSGPLLKKYFIRRVTRLEPPYIIALVAFFVLLVWGIHKYDLQFLAPRFIASLFYSHTLVYHEPSLINSPLWTLEVEVQFYIIAPFLCYLIFGNTLNHFARCLAITAGIVVFSILPVVIPGPNQFLGIWPFMSFFLAGILVTTILRGDRKQANIERIKHPLTLVLIIVFLYNGYDATGMPYQIFVKFLLVAVCVLVLKYKALPWLFTNNLLCVIGGACYSLYLIHYPAISAVGNKLVTMQFSSIPLIDELLHMMAYLIVVMIVGMVFFKFCERPFMDPRWPTKFKAIFSSRK